MEEGDEEKRDREGSLVRREQILDSVSSLFNHPSCPHILDVMDKLSLPKSLFYANLDRDPWKSWWKASQSRTLINGVDGYNISDPAMARDRLISDLSKSGLHDKLLTLLSLADPTTKEGADIILKVANLHVKMMPKDRVEKRPREQGRAEVEIQMKRREALLERREELLGAQESANTKNERESEGGGGEE